MALDLSFFQRLQTATPQDAWAAILDMTWTTCSARFTENSPGTEIIGRDRLVGEIDFFMATSAWDLWKAYEEVVPLCSERLADWWREQDGGKAILILDAFSLRESPWLLTGAESRGFKIHAAGAVGAELPADTTPFAKALGFGQRSALSNNGAGSKHHFPGARTECADISWDDCCTLITPEPNWIFWHSWFDNHLHAHSTPGSGVQFLAKEADGHLTSDSFWQFIDLLATGRRVVITADHGYAASGDFPDSGKEQTEYLRNAFKSGRWSDGEDGPGPWVPPLDLHLETRHGSYLFVNGRRKWKNAGGYPTLTHGGLSVLEVAVPWIEISK